LLLLPLLLLLQRQWLLAWQLLPASQLLLLLL
jgi:hypothetical protein